MSGPLQNEFGSSSDSGGIDIVYSPPRFIEAVKTVIISGLRTTFDSNYPDSQFRNIHISMEYPLLENQYPGIWVKFSFSKIQSTGVGSFFVDSNNNKYKRFYFEGRAMLQVFAMTSLERDKISDSLIYMFAFGDLNPNNNRFKNSITTNNYINMTINSDELMPGGQQENIGAPWQEDAVVYNDSYSFDLIGQFASDINTGALATLDSITFTPYMSGVSGVSVPSPFPPNDGNGTWM